MKINKTTKRKILIILIAVIFPVFIIPSYTMIVSRHTEGLSVVSNKYLYIGYKKLNFSKENKQNSHSKYRLVKFDVNSGRFIEENFFPQTNNGYFHFVETQENQNRFILYERKDFISIFNEDQKPVKRFKLPVPTSKAEGAFASYEHDELIRTLKTKANRVFFLMNTMNTIFSYNFKTGERKIVFENGNTSDIADFDMDSNGNLFILDRDMKMVKKYNPQNKLLKKWKVEAHPKGSAGVFERIHLDQKGNVLVLDSFFEVSEVTTNAGSVQKFDSNGNFLFRIRKTGKGYLGYPENLTTDSKGNIYIIDILDTIYKYDRNGKFLNSWNVHPPREDDSWQTKQKIENIENIPPDIRFKTIMKIYRYSRYGEQKNEIMHQLKSVIQKRGKELYPKIINHFDNRDLRRLSDLLAKDIENSLPFLAEGLKHENKKVVRTCIKTMRKSGSKKVIPHLKPLNSHPDQDIRERALRAIKDTDSMKIIEPLIKALKNGKKYSKSFARWHLKEKLNKAGIKLTKVMTDPENSIQLRKEAFEILEPNEGFFLKKSYLNKAIPALKKSFKTGDTFSKKHSAILLARYGSDYSLDYLTDMLQSNHRRDREIAFNAIEHINTQKAKKLLVNAFEKEQNEKLKRYIFRYLDFNLTDEHLIAKMEKIIKRTLNSEGADTETKKEALEYIKRNKNKHNMFGLYRFVQKENNPGLKKHLIKILGELKQENGVDVLSEIASNEKEPLEIRKEAISSIGKIQSKKGLTVLKKLSLKDSLQESLKPEIIYALAAIGGDREIKDTLMNVLENPKYKEFAACALARMGNFEVLPVLIEALKETGNYGNDFYRQKLVTESIELIGKKAVPDLIELLNYENRTTKRLAAKLLGKINDPRGICPVKKLYYEQLENLTSTNTFLVKSYLKTLIRFQEYNHLKAYIRTLAETNKEINDYEMDFLEEFAGNQTLIDNLNHWLKNASNKKIREIIRKTLRVINR